MLQNYIMHAAGQRALGYQRADSEGLKARYVIAWAGASTASGGPGRQSVELPKPCKGVPLMAQALAKIE